MIASMALSISEVAKQIGLRPSAIRYYEQIGILPPAQRVSGQRRYDVTALHRLVLIQRARQTGFTLNEIKQLFFGVRAGTPPPVRWEKLKKQKIVELDAMLGHIQSMRELLEQQGKCRCTALEECGKKIFEKQCATPETRW
jgi:MerR family transcriptional regulator, redox-sensitive transcriptional activator SoxR